MIIRNRTLYMLIALSGVATTAAAQESSPDSLTLGVGGQY
ncbi:MipA/OmpV family protein, partial [Cronobacter dublinensis subsp. dublinensis]|nr:MipA/OmpV family protein [Cronobacter dublinensis subsp. dublinensis]